MIKRIVAIVLAIDALVYVTLADAEISAAIDVASIVILVSCLWGNALEVPGAELRVAASAITVCPRPTWRERRRARRARRDLNSSLTERSKAWR